jgi:hypothetical protein
MRATERMDSPERLLKLLGRLKVLAGEYYELTGRTLLGVADEIAEYEAAVRLPGVELAPARDRGYDAIRRLACRDQLLQIKGRRVLVGATSRQRTGSIELDKEWDSVLLVLLDDHYEATAIYEADRRALTEAISDSRSRERGQLSVSKFRSIGQRIWANETGVG